MFTINTIFEEIKAVPVDKLEDIYNYVHSFIEKPKSSKDITDKILSFAGAFSDMSEEDYKDFDAELKKSRSASFDRNIDI